MKSDDLIQAFCEKMNLGPAEPEEDGGYLFVVDGSLVVRCISGGRNEMFLCGDVSKVPENEQESEELLKKILRLNLATMKTQKEVLSLDREAASIILFRKVPLDNITAEAFADIVESFINRMEFWCNTVEAVSQTARPFPMMFP